MKNNKIYKVLGLVLFTSNFNLHHSSATNNELIESRYETLEGEYITINDSKEGEVESIEILGNTVQDPDNLEDIQSVGDLYVDENGTPILDSLGREQYKIKILTNNKNYINLDNAYSSTKVNDVGWKIISNEDGVIVCEGDGTVTEGRGYALAINVSNLKPNTEYTLSYKVNGHQYITKSNCIYAGHNSIRITSAEISTYNTFVTPSNISDICIGLYYNIPASNRVEFSEIQLEEGNNITSYQEYSQECTEIITPTQLERVGDIADKIVYKNGVWGVEKWIDKLRIRSCGLDVNATSDNVLGCFYTIPITDSIYKNILVRQPKSLITNWLVCKGNDLSTEGTHSQLTTFKHATVYEFRFRVQKSEYPNLSNISEFNKYLEEIDFYVMIPLVTPEFIPLLNKEEIKLNIFEGKTNIFSETKNGVNPTIKVTVDRLPNICEQAIQLAKENPTIDNISKARMWINLLEESILKDDFHIQINDITQISDLTIETKKVSSSLDVYVKSNNALSLSVSTNSVIFENFTGVDDMEKLNAINITVNSSLPYQLNSYLLDEIKNSDSTSIIEKELFNIKLNGENNYKGFNNINEKVILKDNCLEGNNNQFGIDLIFKGGLAHKADVYKTVIKLEAEQK